jgi:murein DD-endopeptidase MepM/ murein hydrolase activator NlpD
MRRPDLDTPIGILLTGMIAGGVLMASAVACALLGTRRASVPAPPPLPAPVAGREPILALPVDGVVFSAVRNSFLEDRRSHVHAAVDILAPRGAAVRAADGGVIGRLARHGSGGITIEQLSDDGRRCFYYAHLEGYASGLREGQQVRRGELIGFVGTTGNAPARTPHLHFAVFALGAEKRCFSGTPVDPYPLLQ